MFDPYSKWLGIQTHERPPNYYELLGVSPEEKDPDAIEDAANQQILLVVTYKKGPHAAECRRLLDEIAQARDTLADPAQRKAYDSQLGKGSSTQAVQAAAPPAPSATTRPKNGQAAAVQRPTNGPAVKRRREDRFEEKPPAHKGMPAWLWPAVGGATAFLLLVSGLGAWAVYNALNKEEVVAQTPQPEPQPLKEEKSEQPKPAPEKPKEQPKPQPEKPKEQPKPQPVVQAPPPPPPPKPVVVAPPAPFKKLPVPDKASQDRAEKTIRDKYKADYAKKKTEDHLALAARLLQPGRENRQDPAAWFVLFREARDQAILAESPRLALEAIDEIDKWFIIDPAPMKLQALNTIKNKEEKATAVHRAVARAALADATKQLAEDNFEAVKKLLDVADAAARKADSKPLQDRTEARQKELKALQDEFPQTEAARAKLKVMPDDPEANLTVGKHLCWTKGKWDDGLPLLAKGKDVVLVGIAKKDLANPADAPAQMAVADEWRKLALKEKDRVKKNLMTRARYWYEHAEATVAAADKPKLDDRLKEVREATQPSGRLQPGSIYGRGIEDRVLLLRRGGGTYRSEEAVEQGLKWLSQHQDTSGKWSMNEFHKAGKCACQDPGGGYEIAGTAFALLPLLGYGDTHSRGTYSRNIFRGVSFLTKKQEERLDGSFSDNMYENALAALAICEAYGITRDTRLRRSAQAAANFLASAQHDKGSWAYKARDPGDLSVSGWNFMAFKTAEIAGLKVPDETYDKSKLFLDQVMAPGGMGYGYNGPSTAPATSAVGILLREYLGWGPNHSVQAKAIEALVQGENFSTFNRPAIYYLYYLTQVMHHHGGKDWEVWNPRLRDMLISLQDRGEGVGILGHQKGSWSPMSDTHAAAGGRIMYTSLALLILEVYYDHVPLYHYDPLLVDE